MPVMQKYEKAETLFKNICSILISIKAKINPPTEKLYSRITLGGEES